MTSTTVRLQRNSGRMRQAGNAPATIVGRVNTHLTFGTVDGPGVRFVLFLQGCPLRCLYCHNPDSVEMKGGELWTVEKTLATIDRFRGFYRNGGVTFSGGEPTAQPEFVKAVAAQLRKTGLHTALDTSGCVNPVAVKDVIDSVDMLLLDIKAVDAETARRLTGQDNRNAFATLDYCESVGKPVWIRHVLVRGYTLVADRLRELAAKLKRYKCVELVELLPFHQHGTEKWKQVGREYQLAGVEPTSPEEAEWAREFFRKEGLQVQ